MSGTTPAGPAGIADLSPLARRKEQRAWYWYNWAGGPLPAWERASETLEITSG